MITGGQKIRYHSGPVGIPALIRQHVPNEIDAMGSSLDEFFEGMIHKLRINSHKDAIRPDDIDTLLSLMAREIEEFREQRLEDASNPNMLMELVDVANFAFLIFEFLRRRGVDFKLLTKGDVG